MSLNSKELINIINKIADVISENKLYLTELDATIGDGDNGINMSKGFEAVREKLSNDNDENILKLKEIADNHRCVDKIELLPFRKMCQIKYDNLGIKFPFAHIPEPKTEKMQALEKLI